MKRGLRVISIVVATITSISILSGCTSNAGNTSTINSNTEMEVSELLKLGKDENGENTNYYFYDATEEGYKSIRSDVLTPDYYIFAGNKNEEEANKLLKELNMIENIQEWGSKVYVINPINGETYTDEDKEAFIIV